MTATDGTKPTRRGGTVASLLILAYLVAKPFYLFPSGGPQIADGFILLLFAIIFMGSQKLSAPAISLVSSSIIFVMYTALVDGVWFFILHDWTLLKSPLFYGFNTAIIYCFLCVHEKLLDNYWKLLSVGILISLLIQIVLSLTMDILGSYRNILFFNNPNQLGYWALLSASTFALLMHQLRWGIFVQILTFFSMFYIISLSLSKAAIISFFILMLIHFGRRMLHVVIAVISGAVILLFVQDLAIFENVSHRIGSIGTQDDDNLSARGYMRIFEFPQYLVFGAGEYTHSREEELNAVHEFHSTLGVVLFSYGIIGFALFGRIIWNIFRYVGVRPLLYTLPAFAYGITHMGLRFSMFWILFAVVLQVGLAQREGRNSGSSSRATTGSKHLPV